MDYTNHVPGDTITSPVEDNESLSQQELFETEVDLPNDPEQSETLLGNIADLGDNQICEHSNAKSDQHNASHVSRRRDKNYPGGVRIGQCGIRNCAYNERRGTCYRERYLYMCTRCPKVQACRECYEAGAHKRHRDYLKLIKSYKP